MARILFEKRTDEREATSTKAPLRDRGTVCPFKRVVIVPSTTNSKEDKVDDRHTRWSKHSKVRNETFHRHIIGGRILDDQLNASVVSKRKKIEKQAKTSGLHKARTCGCTAAVCNQIRPRGTTSKKRATNSCDNGKMQYIIGVIVRLQCRQFCSSLKIFLLQDTGMPHAPEVVFP